MTGTSGLTCTVSSKSAGLQSLLASKLADRMDSNGSMEYSPDLENSGYTCGAIDTCAASVGSPHNRRRLYWVAYSDDPRDSIDHRLWESEIARCRENDGDAVEVASMYDGYIGWGNSRAVACTDGNYRRVSTESGNEPLVNGISESVGRIISRMGRLGKSTMCARRVIKGARNNYNGRLEGYGNAIVPQVAAGFLGIVMEVICEKIARTKCEVRTR